MLVGAYVCGGFMSLLSDISFMSYLLISAWNVVFASQRQEKYSFFSRIYLKRKAKFIEPVLQTFLLTTLTILTSNIQPQS